VKLLPLLVFLGLAPALPAKAQDNSLQKVRLFVTAKRVGVDVNVIWNKERTFNSGAALARLSQEIYLSPLCKKFACVDAAKGDIILKLEEDVFLIGSETISLKAYDPEDNKEIFSEERQLLAEANDVNRLVVHFLKAVDDEIQALKVAAERKRLEEKEAAEQKQLEESWNLGWTWQPAPTETTSTNPVPMKAWIEGNYFHEKSSSSQKNEGTATRMDEATDCNAVKGALIESTSTPPHIATVLYAGSCTYTFKWVNVADSDSAKPPATCTVSTTEIISVLSEDPRRIEGWSQRIDFTPLKTKQTCPIPGNEWINFAYVPKP
jgi:hypothetical protein